MATRRVNLSLEQAERMIRQHTPGYRMVRLLGAGSFGQVFLVADALAEVAVKIIHLKLREREESNTPSWREDQHEWQQLQRYWEPLHHASLVRIRALHIGSAVDDDDPILEYGLIYMDYWPVHLYDHVKQLVKEGRYTPVHKRALLLQLAIVLQRLFEEAGLVVTDLKPANVMVSPCQSGAPTLAIADLGGICEARLANQRRSLITRFYTAPEVHDDKTTLMDEPVLVYSFGMLGMFLLEGGWPVADYDYDEPLLRKLRMQGGPDWSAETRATMPGCLRIVETALREEREDRYPTMAAVVRALREEEREWIDRDRPRVAAIFSATARKKLRHVWQEPLTGMEFLWIPPGKFWMGQSAEETSTLQRQGDAAHFAKWYARELPRHSVELDGFWMGRLPVTRGQFACFVGDSLYQTDQERQQWAVRTNARAREAVSCWSWRETRFVQDDQHPVVMVSWFDAVQFAEWLGRRTGLLFALPSEAQWEYACRGGSSTPFYFGATINTDQANYYGGATYGSGRLGAYRQGTTSGGIFPANRYGLHDMHGNVWEWCQDLYSDNFYHKPQAQERNPVHHAAIGFRIERGGSWSSSPDMVRSAYRGGSYPDTGKEGTGFRLVLSGLRPPL
ncbi:MAG: SUMF1/EgtB/PvdO family nonheme iron enzyme [Magnetococcus sp. XQGC-1]